MMRLRQTFSVLHFGKIVAQPPCEFTGSVLMEKKKKKTNRREQTPLDDNDATAWYIM